jgi:hypothetical protein
MYYQHMTTVDPGTLLAEFQTAQYQTGQYQAGQYRARPGRQAVVVPGLADLRGPADGTVELPLWLFWSCPGHTFDLSDRDMRRWLYETVLREASRPEDLTTYLNGDTLITLWHDLYLPKGVRQAWEDRHPVLRAVPAAAA